MLIHLNFQLGIILFLIKVLYADESVSLPTKCETCQILAHELTNSLMQDKEYEIIDTVYHLDQKGSKKKPKKYVDSEVRLIEVVESVCEKMLNYKIHPDKNGIERFSKEETSTMNELKKLREKGTKVDIGLPYDLWDTPKVEITQLKKNCESIIETYEEDIEDWYKNKRNKVKLSEYLCKKRVLKNEDKSCLKEEKRLDALNDDL